MILTITVIQIDISQESFFSYLEVIAKKKKKISLEEKKKEKNEKFKHPDTQSKKPTANFARSK